MMGSMPTQFVSALVSQYPEGDWEVWISNHPHNDADEKFPWEIYKDENKARRRTRYHLTPFKYRFVRLCQGLGISLEQSARMINIPSSTIRHIDQKYNEWWRTVNVNPYGDLSEQDQVLRQALELIADKCGAPMPEVKT